MRIDAVSIGKNVPHDVNVIIEVPVGGEPIKYEMDKEAGTLVCRPLPLHADALPR
ncbi:inorganic pyrophosphatase [Bradyrhizobium sp. S3.7.6]